MASVIVFSFDISFPHALVADSESALSIVAQQGRGEAKEALAPCLTRSSRQFCGGKSERRASAWRFVSQHGVFAGKRRSRAADFDHKRQRGVN
ncbi:hypothetical protein [Rhizobium etli]|uniref:hypothetical protein n=1 Tax=Rhizobium etli TaxID=29449 RepID=UPI00059FDC6F|nr:hypothetical protein [Rhizobium etli]